MKIGIMTFWWSNDNYGQLLQCYALQKYLVNMGHDVFFIRYKYCIDVKTSSMFRKISKAFNPYHIIRYFMIKSQKKRVQKEQKLNNRFFDNFRRKYFVFSENNYNSYNELRKNPPVADVYIVGSDQVWNYWNYKLWMYENAIHAYFLDFGSEKVKRIAYAASWGREDISEEYKKEIEPLLKKFNYIGVREKKGIDICSYCGRHDAEWVCDPTLLLTSESYKELYKGCNIRKPTGKYLFLYLLNNTFDFNVQTVFDFAKLKGIEVVYVTGNGMIDTYPKFYATIPEWLYLIENAEYVITNSFHCSVFSTIFHKQFGIIPLSGDAIGMNLRFDSLFEQRKIENRYIYENDFSILDKKYEMKENDISEKILKNILKII